MRCTACGKELTVWDEGFFRKMVNRGARECCCIPCTAAHFGLTEEKAWEIYVYITHFTPCKRLSRGTPRIKSCISVKFRAAEP